LSPPDYFLFPKVKLQLKGARFDTTEGIQKAVTDQLNFQLQGFYTYSLMMAMDRPKHVVVQ
jgi:hypothetical protein